MLRCTTTRSSRRASRRAYATRGEPVGGRHFHLGVVLLAGLRRTCGSIVIPVAAVILGWRALKQIHYASEEMTAATLARIGIILAVGWGCRPRVAAAAETGNGSALWLPSGRLRRPAAGQGDAEPDSADALDLKDKRIYLKGYIAPTRQQLRLRRFVLCPTNGFCQYCNPNPSRTEMIRVTLEGDLTMDYTTRLVGIGGRFHIDEKNPAAAVGDGSGLRAVALPFSSLRGIRIAFADGPKTLSLLDRFQSLLRRFAANFILPHPQMGVDRRVSAPTHYDITV